MGMECHTASMSLDKSMAMTEAAQPMPERLKVRMLLLNLKWFTTAADSDGVGLNAEQWTISASTCPHTNATGYYFYSITAPNQIWMIGKVDASNLL